MAPVPGSQPSPVSAEPHPGPPRRGLRPWMRIAIIVFVTYLSMLLMIGLIQRSLIYHPFRQLDIRAADAGLPEGRVHHISLETADGLELNGWHILAEGCSAASPEECDRQLSQGRPLLLYFSGNAGNRTFRLHEFRMFSELGADTFVFDYRGYGENPGKPSAASFHRDAELAWRYATEVRGVPRERVVLFGESLGGAVAVRLAGDLSRQGTPPGGLVLRSAFASMAETGAYHFPFLPVRLLLTDRFDSRSRIGEVRCPIVQFHGTRDQIVPIAHGRRLFDAAPDRSADGVPKRFVELPGADHNDVLIIAGGTLREELDRFLKSLPKPAGGSTAGRT